MMLNPRGSPSRSCQISLTAIACASIAVVTKREVTLFEGFDGETAVFQRCFFSYVDDQDRAWVGEVRDKRKYDLTDKDVQDNLHLQPDDVAFPEASGSVTRFQSELSTDMSKLYIKRPKIYHLLDKYTRPLVAPMFLEEVQILEFLAHHPHPNIIRYRGCILNRDRITGMVFERHEVTLQNRFRRNVAGFNPDRFRERCQSALDNIHAFGLAHNDINPSNIALDGNDDPIILDWGSCKKSGERLVSAGTPGWYDEDDDIPRSKKEHDTAALAKVMEWIAGEMAASQQKQ